MHIEKNDELDLVEDEEQASLDAKADGIPLIVGFNGIDDNVYVETEENREIIQRVLEERPE